MTSADLIFTNANVITVDLSKPIAEFVAVKNKKILFAGSREKLKDFRGAGTKLIDCEGKTLVPGFIDAHCHIFSNIRKLLNIDLSPPKIKSIDDIKATIKEAAEKTPLGEWITGTDYNDFTLVEKRHPTRWELDEVAPNHPVVISHRSLHACVLNSRALALAKITTETPEPPGAMIGRDFKDGEPNGFLVEMLGYIRNRVMPSVSINELDRGIKLANEQYLSQGLTSLQDATVVNSMKRWRNYQHFEEDGLLKSRVYMMVGWDTFKEFQEAGLHFRSGNDLLRLGAMKIVPSMISDNLHPPQSELNEMVLTAHKAGFQVAIHAVQAGLVDAIIRTYEYLQEQVPDFSLRRHRLEHCAECPPALMERIKQLGLCIATHPSFAYFSGDRYLSLVAADMQPWLYRIGTMVRNSLHVAGASDSPIVSSNPLMGIYGGITRLTSSGQKMNQDERIRVNQALALYTINAAYLSHEENIKGSITPGKLADMVLLSDDPCKVSPEQIKDIKVQMTVIGGKVVWEA
jgi:hypothetical protein